MLTRIVISILERHIAVASIYVFAAEFIIKPFVNPGRNLHALEGDGTIQDGRIAISRTLLNLKNV